jgi:hypothetical protein
MIEMIHETPWWRPDRGDYMKKMLVLFTVISGLAFLACSGCSKSGGVDTSKVESAFTATPQADRSDVDKAVACVKAGDYPGALTSLQKAASNLKLTPEQQQALQDLMAQVQAKVSETVKKAADDASKGAKEGANKAAGDLQKSLGK